MTDSDNILVLDIETTGLNGYEKGDKVLSIGIVTVSTARHTVTPTFYAPIHQKLTEKDLKSWIFSTKNMLPEEISDAPWGGVAVAELVLNMIECETVTTYNTEFDLDLFLDPWLKNTTLYDPPFYTRAPCLMKACNQVEEIPRTVHADYTSWPSLKASYYQLCKDRVAGIKMHNALNDAMIAGEVLLALMDRGLYDPDREEEYA